jgi:dienelactone hydrolase
MRFALIVLVLLGVVASQGGVVGKQVDYTVDGITLKGYIAYNDTIKESRAGVLVVHEWWGNNDYSRMRANMLADLGYVAPAVDMYGNGQVVDNPGDAGRLSGETMKNMRGMKARFAAALDLLKKNSSVDSSRIAAIGYCFGGGVVLNMASAGGDLRGVVSFHPGLGSVLPAEKGKVKAKILVCNGAADKFNSEETIKNFKAGLDSAEAEYRFVDYPEALHAFTNPAATENGKKFNMPIAYNEKADKQSWADMQMFLKNVLSK